MCSSLIQKHFSFLFSDFKSVGHSLQLLLQTLDLLLGTESSPLLCSQLPLEAVGTQLQVALQLLETHTNTHS